MSARYLDRLGLAIIRKRQPARRHCIRTRCYFASQGIGIHLLPFGSILKWVLVMKGCARYIGSSTIVVMIR